MDNIKKDENAKDPAHQNPAKLSSVSPEDYAKVNDQSGVEGFSPQLAGNAKAGHHNTSSFDASPPTYTAPSYPNGSTAGQEEGGRPKQKTTSAAGVLVSDGKNNE